MVHQARRTGLTRPAEPIRVLQSFAGLGRGGAEQLAMNWYRRIDRSRIQFDFVAEHSERTYEHVDEIESLGGRVFFVPRYRFSGLLDYIGAWRRLLAEHPEWSIVHAHHTTPAAIYLTVARTMNRICIAHSHNTDQQRSLKAFMRRALGRPLNLIANQRLACGVAAGRAMFGRGSFEVVPNSISVEDFEFKSETRDEIRSDLKVGSDLVVGHVGRFSEVKNHRAIVDVFTRLLLRRPTARLVLVGEGPLRSDIEYLVADRGIAERVEFLGSRDDVNRLMNAMDVLLLPSLYEGLPVTLVEAQANGLPSVISDTITDEVRLTPTIRAVPLAADPDRWVDAIVEAAQVSILGRAASSATLRGSEYDIGVGVERISQVYEGLARRGQFARNWPPHGPG